MKLWDVILTANANLSRNKVRTFLTIIAVFIGAFTIALTAGVNAGVNDYIDRQLGNIGGESMLEVQAKQTSAAISTGPQEYDPDASKSNDALGLGLTMLKQNDIEKIAAIDNIKSVTPGVAVVATWIQGVNDKKYNITIGQMVEGLNVDLAYGTPPSNSTDEYQMALSDGYATVLGFNDAQDAVGKTVTFAATTPLGEIKTVEAKVVGIQNNNLISSSGSLVNDALNNALYDITTEGMPDTAKQQYIVAIAIMEDYSTEEIVTKTKDAINEAGFQASTIADRIGIISSVINAITVALIGFGAIALIAAVFGVVNTLFMAVQERTREIGLMKAMGMSRRRIFALFSIEAILIGFWGSAIGVLGAFGVGQVINQIAEQTFLKDLQGFVLMQFPVMNTVAIILVIMFITYLAGALPARRAARQNPIDALRYE